MPNHSRMMRLIERCRHHRDATRVWNLIDHLPNGDLFWSYMIARRPEFFSDPTNVNSIRFTYDTDEPEGEDFCSTPSYLWKHYHGPHSVDYLTRTYGV